MERFTKIMNEFRCPNRKFSGQGGGGRFVELGHIDKISSKTQLKRVRRGKVLEFFHLGALKTIF